ncbi:MAG TPA: hypothetical protein VGR82_20885 [Methylomirabilota bacterium]|jgi:hypothetical protein|nr:hypothetical protein [Methylomirabilota bacterium]
MSVRWLVASALALSMLTISALELSACAANRAAAAHRAPSVAAAVTDRGVEIGVPTAPEVDVSEPSTSPVVTY